MSWTLMEAVMVEVGRNGWVLSVFVFWELSVPCAYVHDVSNQAGKGAKVIQQTIALMIRTERYLRAVTLSFLFVSKQSVPL